MKYVDAWEMGEFWQPSKAQADIIQDGIAATLPYNLINPARANMKQRQFVLFEIDTEDTKDTLVLGICGVSEDGELMVNFFMPPGMGGMKGLTRWMRKIAPGYETFSATVQGRNRRVKNLLQRGGFTLINKARSAEFYLVPTKHFLSLTENVRL